jgi:hypothetical protein
LYIGQIAYLIGMRQDSDQGFRSELNWIYDAAQSTLYKFGQAVVPPTVGVELRTSSKAHTAMLALNEITFRSQ